ncbi:FkbM family methyltransferase [Phenylobacterium sp. J426]|uniref:FkbM family methyltransferase n=1 Tax=Phenylobacterium sp. J426 TaxID=2898439 RepID=UPI0021515A86|nr:FkbM family methyltransferase [Phenylobacterium sp. J426]MCR5874967.1 FkbM family methyltransferase [Phenylobacterium sp. J426]
MSITHVPGVLTEFSHRGRQVRFFVKNMADAVQNFHLNGNFYEADTLSVIEGYLRPGDVFLDVGANVGNHAIYVALYCQPGEVIVVEPNPEAIPLLRANLALNYLVVNTQHVGVGLSDAPRQVVAQFPRNNLGAARMVEQEDGRLRLVVGDELFADRKIDFIKIDVEGHELGVLNGLKRTLAANRPTIFLEIDTANRDAVFAWIEEHGYEVAHAFRQYTLTQNVILRPKAG